MRLPSPEAPLLPRSGHWALGGMNAATLKALLLCFPIHPCHKSRAKPPSLPRPSPRCQGKQVHNSKGDGSGSAQAIPTGEKPRRADSPPVFPAGNEHRQDVEGQEDAQAEEDSVHVGLCCGGAGETGSRTWQDWLGSPCEPRAAGPPPTHSLLAALSH